MGSVSNLIGIRGRSRGHAAPIDPIIPSAASITAVDDNPAALTEDTGLQLINVLANDIFTNLPVGSVPTITITGQSAGFTASVTGVGAAARIQIDTTPSTLSAPVNTVLPVISGTPTVGQNLSVTTGTWTGNPTPTFTYQWLRAGSNISSATSSTYLLVTADIGQVSCRVTATNSQGAVPATSAEVTVSAASTGQPSIVSVNALAGGFSGATNYSRSFTVANNSNRKLLVIFAEELAAIVIASVQYGGVALTLIHSAVSGNARVEIWELNSPTVGTANITWNTGNTASSIMVALDIRDSSQAVIGAGDKTTVTSASGTSASTALTSVANSLLLDALCGGSSTTVITKDPASPATQIANVTAAGQNTCGVSAFTATGVGTVTLNWTFAAQQFAKVMLMIRPATGGAAPINTVLPAISGTPTVGQLQTASTGTWSNSPTSFAYQWKIDGVNVGTNANTYTTVAAGSLTVVVTATNASGSTPATSSAVTITTSAFVKNGAVQIATQATRVQNWTPISRSIGTAVGNDRLHIERFSYGGDIISNIQLNGVEGITVHSRLHGGVAGSIIMAWTDTMLPAGAGNYNLVVTCISASGAIGVVLGQTFLSAEQSGWLAVGNTADNTATVTASAALTMASADYLLDVLRTDDNDVLSSYVPSGKTIQNSQTGVGGFTNSFAFAEQTGLTGAVTPAYTLTATSVELELAAIRVRSNVGGLVGLIGHWKLDETSGLTAVDAIAARNGVYTAPEFSVNPLVSGSSHSVGFNGTSSDVEIPHNSAFAASAYSIVAYFQLDTSPPSIGSNYIILSKHAAAPVEGSLSIEAYQDSDGLTKLRAYTINSSSGADFIGVSSGVSILQLGTAHLVVLTVGPSGTRLYHRRAFDGPITTTVGFSANTAGLQGITDPMVIGSYRGSVAWLDGVIDDVRFYNTELNLAQIQAFPVPQTIVH